MLSEILLSLQLANKVNNANKDFSESINDNVGNVGNVGNQEVKSEATIKTIVLKLIAQKNSISIREIATHTKLSTRQVERIIAQLKQDNKLERQGSNRSGQWLVKEKEEK